MLNVIDVEREISPGALLELTYFRGRVALYAILKALGIGDSDYVAIQALTCVAVPEAVLAAGATPLFIDVVQGGYTMSPSDLVKKIDRRTKAIVVQHTFGIPDGVDEIAKIAAKMDIPVIEDCCHSFLSTAQGRRVGTFGLASFFSFEWGKPIVAGMGGSAVTQDVGLRETLTRAYGAFEDPPAVRNLRIECEYLGYALMFRPKLYWLARRLKHVLGRLRIVESSYNGLYGVGVSSDFKYRMGQLSRRRLASTIGKIESAAAHSNRIVEQYRNRIRSSYVIHPRDEDGYKPVYGRYPLLTREKNALMRAASRAMVEVAGWYATPVHPLEEAQWAAVGYISGSCPNAEQQAGELVTLPTHVKVTQSDVDRTVGFFNSLQL